ncbi:MAG: LacI family DNA-binding transcriptional regulator [bacterium]|nr:MAG: LacI family DNA-binding transcriptional regulator [bacterium]
MITIKDIARLADVSVSTVSKALNDRPDVGAVTKKKILEIVQQYHFSPNAFGKGLKSQTSENIGVIFCREMQPLSGNPFFSRVLEGIEAELAINNYNLVLQLIPESRQDTLPKMVRQRQVDGLILVGIFQEYFIQNILSNNILVVLVDPKIRINECSQVLIDNEHGAFTATQYLIQKGHRRIGFISDDVERLSFKQRFDGFKKALKYNEIPFDKNLIMTGGSEKGYEHVKRLLKLENRPTAIFTTNDINAIHGYKAIQEQNLKIPDDVSIVGFDDIDLAKHSTPSLTTIRVYKEELGSIGVRTLLQMINGENKTPVTTIVPTRLIERESVKGLEKMK